MIKWILIFHWNTTFTNKWPVHDLIATLSQLEHAKFGQQTDTVLACCLQAFNVDSILMVLVLISTMDVI